jgi:hypothetical protein
MEVKNEGSEGSCASPCSPLAGAVRRLRMVDSYGIDWSNILRDPDTDPQMMRDVQQVVRQQIMLDKSGFFLAFDNSEPPQLWVFRGDPTDECAEPWQRVNF